MCWSVSSCTSLESLKSGKMPIKLPLWDRASAEFCFARSRDLLSRFPGGDSSTEVLDSVCSLNSVGSVNSLSLIAVDGSETSSTCTLKDLGQFGVEFERFERSRIEFNRSLSEFGVQPPPPPPRKHKRTVSESRVVSERKEKPERAPPPAPRLRRKVGRSSQPCSPMRPSPSPARPRIRSSSLTPRPVDSTSSSDSDIPRTPGLKYYSSYSSSSSEDLSNIPGFTENFLSFNTSTKF